MPFDRKHFFNVSRASVLTPAMTAIWDSLGIGVAVVNAEGVCEYMNPIQRRVDGFSKITVTGRHITSLYVPHDIEIIPTIECLQKGEPLLKKAYWYETTNHYLASTVTDFIPLFDHGRKDGVITFIIWTGTTTQIAAKSRPRHTSSKNAGLRFYTFESLVGVNPALLDLIEEAKTAAKTSFPVMIWGESGTGKELFAQAIHAAGTRSEQPFIPVNCAAIPENLLEGILFGTVKGAYTDAPDKPGLFEMADGGTLLFDELNSMPLGLQAKLLRVIQEKRVRRLGAHTEIPIDVRVISMLNEDPLLAVSKGCVRRDLFYRLAVIGLGVPPLRERKTDIPLLARTFIEHSELRPPQGKVDIADDVLALFQEYDWPGNVRELLHVMEGSLALLGGLSTIEASCLPRHFRQASQSGGHAAPQGQSEFAAPPSPAHVDPAPRSAPENAYFDYRTIRRNDVEPIKNRLREYEAQCIKNVLRVTGGNVAKAARIMELSAAGLHYRMKVLQIDDEEI